MSPRNEARLRAAQLIEEAAGSAPGDQVKEMSLVAAELRRSVDEVVFDVRLGDRDFRVAARRETGAFVEATSAGELVRLAEFDRLVHRSRFTVEEYKKALDLARGLPPKSYR